MEHALWGLSILHVLASHCVQEALESSPSTLLAPQSSLCSWAWAEVDLWRLWGVLNSWHSEVSLLGRVSSPKNSISICVS